MALAVAERRVKDLTVLPPDIPAYETMNNELERVVSQYAPVWENDKTGNLYLDITGTTGLFGPPCDCSSRILREIIERLEIKPATAVASNKLVSKVATRTIRPTGLIQIKAGTEAEFMSHQDIRILPGMGPGLLRAAEITGIREIGEAAALSVSEAHAIFGKQGPLLRSMAQGIDGSCVEERDGERQIAQQADFDEDIVDETAIRGLLRH
jgi:DNA polymerase-4